MTMTKEQLFALATDHVRGIDHDRMVRAAAREIALRANLYPRKMLEGRMTEREAVDELSAMMAILETLKNHG
jgi:hypothetical protein